MVYALHQLLAETASRHPERTAVFARGEELTYRELEEESNRLAHLLRDRGVKAGDRVGLHSSKSVRSVIAMIGALKAGAAYVPIDPRAPAKRVRYIVENCGIRALVADRPRMLDVDRALRESFAAAIESGEPEAGAAELEAVVPWSSRRGYSPEKPPDLNPIETDPAYILYTSGSTGQPKGVVITHRNALTFVNWCAETFRIGKEDRLSNHAPFHFDLSVFDLYNAIEAGAAVYLVHEEVAAFPRDLIAFVEAHRLTVWYSVPSALIYLLLHGNLSSSRIESLRLILFAGEVFPMKYLRELAGAVPRAELYNLYGPTETNVCTYYRVDRRALDRLERLPIGRACGNTEVFALNDEGRPVQPGEPGELHVRGPSVTPGYWGDPEKSRRSIVRNPLRVGFEENVYRTGDIVTLDAEGDYDFLGRRDNMIKSRGYRIELGEIEAALYDHQGVREAAVVAIPDETVGNRIKAIIVPHEPGSLSRAAVEQHCAKVLPRYMIPELIEFSEGLPKTPSGKTDRVKLVQAASASGG